jgi:lysophospholipase L1-like esterase
MDDRAREGGRYVALGSSFAAGPGIAPVVDRRARRSGRNYAHQVADALSLSLTDVTFSGATTAHVLQGRRKTPAQLEAVTADTALVTITIGGNDIGYIGGLLGASLAAATAHRVGRVSRRAAGWLRGRVSLHVDARRVEEAQRAMALVGEEVRRRAPDAQVVFVDYLTVVGDCELTADVPTPRLPLTADDLRLVARTAECLAGAFAAAAEQSGAGLVRASAASVGHGPLSAEPWVTGFEGGFRRDAPMAYHPTLAGMTAVARMITEHVRAR